MVQARVFDSKNPDDSALNREGYVGVDPIYQNYANDTDEPIGTDEDEKVAREQGTPAGAKPEDIAQTPSTSSDKEAEEDERTPVEARELSTGAGGTSAKGATPENTGDSEKQARATTTEASAKSASTDTGTGGDKSGAATPGKPAGK